MKKYIFIIAFLFIQLAHADNHLIGITAGGFGITYGGDELLQLSGGGLYKALGFIFVVLFSLIAIFIGFRKLKSFWDSIEIESDSDGENSHGLNTNEIAMIYSDCAEPTGQHVVNDDGSVTRLTVGDTEEGKKYLAKTGD